MNTLTRRTRDPRGYGTAGTFGRVRKNRVLVQSWLFLRDLSLPSSGCSYTKPVKRPKTCAPALSEGCKTDTTNLPNQPRRTHALALALSNRASFLCFLFSFLSFFVRGLGLLSASIPRLPFPLLPIVSPRLARASIYPSGIRFIRPAPKRV